jgi:hypothetical protein
MDRVAGFQSLLAMSVQPSTAKAYVREVEKFLNYVEENKLLFVSWDEKDQALASYVAHLCLHEECGPERGACAVSGWVYLDPRVQHRIPLAWRCLLAWKRNFVPGEGRPESEETIACIAEAMRLNGDTEAADVVWLCLDGYLRESECIQIQASDVVELEGRTAILLGAAERGERVKTGRNQTISLDWQGTKEMVRRRCKRGGRLFNLTAAKYRGAWLKAIATIQTWDECSEFTAGPPHSVRHTGASRDMYVQYRSLDQIQKRGRWTSWKSVNRYAKPHSWMAAQTRTLPAIRRRGEELLLWRGGRRDKAED